MSKFANYNLCRKGVLCFSPKLCDLILLTSYLADSVLRETLDLANQTVLEKGQYRHGKQRSPSANLGICNSKLVVMSQSL